MTEMSIIRGRDIRLSLDGTALCGVTHFSAASRYERHELHEYLSAAPYAEVPEGESHEIVMEVLSLFKSVLDGRDGFTLSAEDKDSTVAYHGCHVVKIERDIRGDQPAADRYTIRAAGMTKRRREDA